MTSKDRVKTVLKGDIPDKVPWGEWAIDFDTVSKIIGHETFYRAKAKSQFAFWNGRRDEVVQSWKEDSIAFFKEMDCFDIVNIAAMASSVAPPKGFDFEKPKKIDDNTWEFKSGKVIKYSEVTADITTVFDPNAGKETYSLEDYEKDPVIGPVDESCFEVVDAVIKALGSDRFTMGPSGHEVGIHLLGGNIEEGGMGFTNGLMQYYDNPEIVRAAITYEVKKNNLLDSIYIRKGQDSVAWGQDFSSSQGPLISPEMFREFCLPAIKTRVAHIHKNFGLPVMKHACGNNNKLLDMFVVAGYDAYQSVQRTAGMDIVIIKKDYGKNFVPWGGVNVETLLSGTPEDVRRDVRETMTAMKSGGGWIFGTSHSIAVGTKYENFMTLVDEFDKNRNY